MITLPLYIAIPVAYDINAVAAVAGALRRPSPHGGHEILREPETILAVDIGQASIDGTLCNVSLLYVMRGSVQAGYRALKDHPQVEGPWTWHNAPAGVLELIDARRSGVDWEGNPTPPAGPMTTLAISGVTAAQMDQLDYVEGAAADGSDDQIVEAAP